MNFRFISQVIYELKKEYSDIVDFYKEELGELDLTTGTRTITRTKVRVRKALILDATTMLKYLGKNEGVFNIEDRFFIVDKTDFPSSYVLNKDDYCIYKHKKYKIKEIKLFEYERGFLIKGVYTPTDNNYEEHEAYINQILTFEESLEGAKE